MPMIKNVNATKILVYLYIKVTQLFIEKNIYSRKKLNLFAEQSVLVGKQ